MPSHPRTLLVTGASGQLGRRVVELLLERRDQQGAADGERVVAMSRSTGKLADLEARGAEARHGDFDDPRSLDAAFRGVDRLLLISTDAVGQPGRRAQQHAVAISAAARAGVEHVVYTSLTHPTEDNPIPIAKDHLETEAALAAAPFGFTALRNNLYADYLLDALVEAARTGEYVTARGQGAIAYISREDCARAAAAALVTPSRARTFEISGPEALTGDALAAIASKVGGRPVSHRSISPEAWTQRLVDAGVPRTHADFYASYEVAASRGMLARVTGDVRALTGGSPRSVRALLEDYAPVAAR